VLKKVDNLRKQLATITSELTDLDKFRDTKSLRKFRRQLQGEISFVKSEIVKLEETQEDREKQRLERIENANRNRSSKNKRVWNYVKSIHENYHPDLTLREIRSQLKRHRQGLETEVSDVAWRNPSP